MLGSVRLPIKTFTHKLLKLTDHSAVSVTTNRVHSVKKWQWGGAALEKADRLTKTQFGTKNLKFGLIKVQISTGLMSIVTTSRSCCAKLHQGKQWRLLGI